MIVSCDESCLREFFHSTTVVIVSSDESWLREFLIQHSSSSGHQFLPARVFKFHLPLQEDLVCHCQMDCYLPLGKQAEGGSQVQACCLTLSKMLRLLSPVVRAERALQQVMLHFPKVKRTWHQSLNATSVACQTSLLEHMMVRQDLARLPCLQPFPCSSSSSRSISKHDDWLLDWWVMGFFNHAVQPESQFLLTESWDYLISSPHPSCTWNLLQISSPCKSYKQGCWNCICSM